MGRTPARVLERRKPAAEERCRPSDRPLEQRTVERGRLRRGRLLEQSRGTRGIGPRARVRHYHRFYQTAEAHHQHHRGLGRRNCRAGPRRGWRSGPGGETVQTIAPIEPVWAGAGPGLQASLRDQAALHRQRVGERQRREERDGLDPPMGRAGAIDPAYALRQPGRAPGQVVVDRARGVLEIQAFTQEIGCDEDVGLECEGGRGSALRSWCECAQHFLPPGGLAPEPAPLSRHRREAVAAKAAHQVMHRGPGLDEDDRLARAPIEQARQRVRFGIVG